MPGAISKATQAELRQLRSFATGILFEESSGPLSLTDIWARIKETGYTPSLGAVSTLRARVNDWRRAVTTFAQASDTTPISHDMVTWDLTANQTQRRIENPEFYAIVELMHETPEGPMSIWRTLTDFEPFGLTKGQVLNAAQDLADSISSVNGTLPGADLAVTGSIAIVQF